MYTALLVTHSMLRWVVLFILLAAIGLSIKGMTSDGEWTSGNKKLNIATIASVHSQVLIGLLLYVGISPVTKAAFADMGAAMKSNVLRFWAVEHIFTMVLGAVIIHVAHVLSKRAEEDKKKFKTTAIGFSLGLFLILAGIPWPFREAVGRGLLPGF